MDLLLDEIGINFAVGAEVVKRQVAAFRAEFEFDLILLEILDVDLVPTNTARLNIQNFAKKKNFKRLVH